MSLFKKRSKIILDKGDTLGGTAPLLLLDQVVAGRSKKNNNRAYGIDQKKTSFRAFLIVSISMIVTISAVGLQFIDRSFLPAYLEKIGL